MGCWIVVYNKNGDISNSSLVEKSFAMQIMKNFKDAVYIEKTKGVWKRRIYKGMMPFWETLVSF